MCSFHSLFCYLEGAAIAVVMMILDSELLGVLWFGNCDCSFWPWKAALNDDYWGQKCVCECLPERKTFLSPHKMLRSLFSLTAYPTQLCSRAFLSNDNCKEITPITRPRKDISWSFSLSCALHLWGLSRSFWLPLNSIAWLKNKKKKNRVMVGNCQRQESCCPVWRRWWRANDAWGL